MAWVRCCGGTKKKTTVNYNIHNSVIGNNVWGSVRLIDDPTEIGAFNSDGLAYNDTFINITANHIYVTIKANSNVSVNGVPFNAGQTLATYTASNGMYFPITVTERA